MREDSIIVMTTVENSEQSYKLIDCVMGEKLAACVQTREIESHYVWKEELCHEKEILIWFKTESRLYESIENLLIEIHPYDLPEIISVPIQNMSDAYAEWMHENVKE